MYSRSNMLGVADRVMPVSIPASLTEDSPYDETSRILSEWLDEAENLTLTDYDQQEDALILVYDPKSHPNPWITLQPKDGKTRILLNNQELAVINGAISLEEITLLPI